MADRLQAARDYVARKPTDRFGLFTLAMELRKLHAWPESFAAWEALIEHHPTYGAGYYHFAMTRKESGDRAGCIEVLRHGLPACATSGDAHTKAEIESALDELEDE